MSETIEYKGLKIKIEQDQDAESPSAWGDNSLFLVANHRDFYVPEPGEKRCPSDPAELLEWYKSTHWIFPLEAYIHSGVRLAFGHEGNFPDRRWDVSQLGFIFAAKKEWRLNKSARKAAASLIETWNQYLTGDVYGYIVEDGEPDEESCWGFYGYDYCVEQAKEQADSILAHRLKAKTEKAKAFIKNAVPLDKRTFATA